MPAYLLFVASEISDPDKMNDYVGGLMPTLQEAGAKVLAAEDDADVVEGEWDAASTVIIEFPSMEAATTWYNSEEYKKVAPLRHAASKGDVVFLRGLPPPA